uniref:DUF1702 family protein n=1 Tax=Nocardia suismassiliense TaxID=2077092 RepID=UPI003F4953D8
MSSLIGSLRRNALAPSLHEVSFRARGFTESADAVVDHLEAIPQSVVVGFEWAMDSAEQWDLVRRLNMIDPELRGFAYEGAVMGLTIRDVASGQRTRELLLGPGQRHIFLAYIGIGFALARLPRKLWQRAMPDLSGSRYHPTMAWLAVDGYGFDRAYFDTQRWVDEQWIPPAYPWDGYPDYFLRAVDQGIGRALWFIHCADCRAVAAAVDRFDIARRADLWSGVGLAAAFAGGASDDALRELRTSAGAHGAELAVGAIFAAKARNYAGYVPDHTTQVVAVFTGRSIDAAIAIADDTEISAEGNAAVPQYELWRDRIRQAVGGRSPARPTVLSEKPGK